MASEKPPLSLRENAERLPLYEELYAVLHNVRALRVVEADTEEMEAIKLMADADTTELRLPRTVAKPRTQPKADEVPPRVKKHHEEKRKEQFTLDALKRQGSRSRKPL
jgi:hypothetical protein